MSVIHTDKWLNKWYYNPVQLCERLEKYFPDVLATDIHHYLSLNGMYRRPNRNGESFIENVRDKFKIVEQEHQYLKNKWNGPDIPIFIFPSDPTNRKIIREFNGKSGLAFKDKLFLFISDHNTKDEIRALFTHEYNHVCRLAHSQKIEGNFTLLDTIVLEGLAENAVHERLGKKHLAAWTSYYSIPKLKMLWEDIVKPNKDVSINSRKHNQILYGLQLYPKMTGYAVGFYIVETYLKEHHLEVKNLLKMDSKKIANCSL
ncbi:DUF2268 domain-containing protein [Oceanobacillus salinisoli]|uniref:DUF2268 domain-containing protein n=1 Tax=Oceanobacillus salinisoli TaxID=2678611 RepID=UPI0012E27433|nr:DUF2268 domain-containing protein [Oceanobacillus salinisoli]